MWTISQNSFEKCDFSERSGVTAVLQKIQKPDRPLWTFVIFGDIIKPHVNIYIFNVKSKEEQENGKKNEDHGR